MADLRIRTIHDAAVRLFLRQGYAQTQISHIAQAAGISVGSIYHDFTGKEAILRLILQCALDADFLERELPRPIGDDLFPQLDNQLIAALEQSADSFAANLERAGWDYPFSALLSDTFDVLSRHAVGCLFIEKNPRERPALTAYYQQYRKTFFSTMTAYLDVFQKCGQLRALKEPELTAVLMIEQLSWWAMDVHWTAFETRDIAPERAKAVCLDNLLAAYAVS